MASHRIVCHGCSKPFMAKTSRAKWCGSTCQKRQRRAAAAVKAASGAPEHALVLKVREELAEAEATGTVDGLLAVHLALAIAAAEGTGKVGPITQFVAVRARVLGLEVAPTPTGEPADDTPEAASAAADRARMDEVKRRRDEKKNAARAAG